MDTSDAGAASSEVTNHKGSSGTSEGSKIDSGSEVDLRNGEIPAAAEDELLNAASPLEELLHKTEDKKNLVLAIVTLHGLGVLIAWNVFITIAPMYFQDYKLKSVFLAKREPLPSYVTSFMNYVCICSQMPNLIVNGICLFADKGNLFRRITFSLFVIIGVVILTLAFTLIDTSSRPLDFFLLTMATVVVLNCANGIYQNSLYGMVGSYPQKYINAVIIGNNLCGLFVTLVSLVISCFIENPATTATVYFSIVLLLIFVCLGTIFLLRDNDYYVYQAAIEKRATNARVVFSVSDYATTFCQYFPRMVNIFATFFITLLLFPSVFLEIHLYPLAREDDWDAVIPQRFYATIVVFLNFNFFAVVGCKIADYVKFPPRYVFIPVTLRLVFIPLTFACNFSPPDVNRAWGPYIHNEWAVFAIIAACSLTHGYLSSLVMMYAPMNADPSRAVIIGKMSAFVLVSAIIVGIAASFGSKYAVML